jgi:hypothetical protein
LTIFPERFVFNSAELNSAFGVPECDVSQLASATIKPIELRAVMNLPMIGKLLDHADVRTTTRYAHLDDGHVIEAAQRIGDLIE